MAHLKVYQESAGGTMQVYDSRPRVSWRERLAEAWRGITLGPYDPKDRELARLFGSREVAAGVSVTEQTALTLSAVYQAVQLIAGHVGSLPLKFYAARPGGGGRTRS